MFKSRINLVFYYFLSLNMISLNVYSIIVPLFSPHENGSRDYCFNGVGCRRDADHTRCDALKVTEGIRDAAPAWRPGETSSARFSRWSLIGLLIAGERASKSNIASGDLREEASGERWLESWERSDRWARGGWGIMRGRGESGLECDDLLFKNVDSAVWKGHKGAGRRGEKTESDFDEWRLRQIAIEEFF